MIRRVYLGIALDLIQVNVVYGCMKKAAIKVLLTNSVKKIYVYLPAVRIAHLNPIVSGATQSKCVDLGVCLALLLKFIIVEIIAGGTVEGSKGHSS